jgi:hypothetical protein
VSDSPSLSVALSVVPLLASRWVRVPPGCGPGGCCLARRYECCHPCPCRVRCLSQWPPYQHKQHRQCRTGNRRHPQSLPLTHPPARPRSTSTLPCDLRHALDESGSLGRLCAGPPVSARARRATQHVQGRPGGRKRRAPLPTHVRSWEDAEGSAAVSACRVLCARCSRERSRGPMIRLLFCALAQHPLAHATPTTL